MEHDHSNGADRESARGHAEHIAALTSCAEECRRCAAADKREGMDDCAAVCESCAEVCEACGDECAKFQMDHCQECAQACRRCADECRRMAGMTPGQQRGAGSGARAH